jgi:hypothetical protein
VTVRVVVALRLGRRVRREQRLDGGYSGQCEARGDHALEKGAPVGI